MSTEVPEGALTASPQLRGGRVGSVAPVPGYTSKSFDDGSSHTRHQEERGMPPLRVTPAIGQPWNVTYRIARSILEAGRFGHPRARMGEPDYFPAPPQFEK